MWVASWRGRPSAGPPPSSSAMRPSAPAAPLAPAPPRAACRSSTSVIHTAQILKCSWTDQGLEPRCKCQAGNGRLGCPPAAGVAAGISCFLLPRHVLELLIVPENILCTCRIEQDQFDCRRTSRPCQHLVSSQHDGMLHSAWPPQLHLSFISVSRSHGPAWQDTARPTSGTPPLPAQLHPCLQSAGGQALAAPSPLPAASAQIPAPGKPARLPERWLQQ